MGTEYTSKKSAHTLSELKNVKTVFMFGKNRTYAHVSTFFVFSPLKSK